MENQRNAATHSLDQVSQSDHDGKGVSNDDEEIHQSETECAQDKCPEGMCDGSGEIATDEFDPDSGQYMRGVGTQKCLCKTKK